MLLVCGLQVLETLHAPVDNESFDMKCITMDSGMRFVIFKPDVCLQCIILDLICVISPLQQYVNDTKKQQYRCM